MALLTPLSRRKNHSGNSWDHASTFHDSIFDPSVPLPFFDGPVLDRSIFRRDYPDGVAGTRVDWKETPEEHVFKADLPGMKKEEVKVETVDGRTLRISGERIKEKVEEKDAWRCVERSHGKFSRQFKLPENAKLENVSAKMENGVLTVTVPKTDSVRPQVRSIDVA